MDVDQLASAVGLSVRTTRYYATLGLLPPPLRRGRFACYDERHRARLELVRALQGNGFSLQAIERYLTSLPADATPEDVAVRRVMLTSWSEEPAEVVTRRALDRYASRRLSEPDLARLVEMGTVEVREDGYLPAPNFRLGVACLDLDVAPETIAKAGRMIADHMDALAGELDALLREEVVGPAQGAGRMGQLTGTLGRLRTLTLEAVVTGWQRAANARIASTVSGARAPSRRG